MDDLTLWAWLLLLTQLCFYISCASVVAVGFFISFSKLSIPVSLDRSMPTGFQSFAINYGLWMSTLGFFAVIVYVLLSVGAFAESGFKGMFDTVIFSIVWESSLGYVARYRLIAFCILFFCFLLFFKLRTAITSIPFTKYIAAIFIVVAFYLLARSFSIAGHSGELSLTLQYILSLHVFLVMFWIGSLYPLYKACYQLPSEQLYLLMHNFGYYAAYLVGILLVSGFTLLYFLLNSTAELINTIYGRWFIAKLLGVSLVLLLALRHKKKLVPLLLNKPTANVQLATSIKIEMLLALAVLSFTYVVSHLVGPEHLSH